MDILADMPKIPDKNFTKNPLGIIALFVFLIEVVSTYSMNILVDTNYLGHLVWFVILFPSVIAFLFFGTLWFKSASFYSPQDFREDESFLRLNKKIEVIYSRQEAEQITVDAPLDFAFNLVGRLLKNGEVSGAIKVGRAYLTVSDYESSHAIFKYICDNTESENFQYSRAVAHLAYSEIGLKKYEKGIKQLLKVYELSGETKFFVWNSVALAYAYYKMRDTERFEHWLSYSKKRKEFGKHKKQLAELYDEITSSLI